MKYLMFVLLGLGLTLMAEKECCHLELFPGSGPMVCCKQHQDCCK